MRTLNLKADRTDIQSNDWLSFGYAVSLSRAPLILEIRSRGPLKESRWFVFLILFSCQRTDVRRKGRQIARPLRPCQAGRFDVLDRVVNPSRLTRTPLPYSLRRWKDRGELPRQEEPLSVRLTDSRCQLPK